MEKEHLNRFSVPLGLLDYVNPIFYTITMILIAVNLHSELALWENIILWISAGFSILCGLVIPTGKVLVGLGIIKFTMPVPLVFCVNLGIFFSGLLLFYHCLSLPLWLFFVILGVLALLLVLLLMKTKKPNTVAVLTGAFGYLMIYISLIVLSVNKGIIVPIILYAFAILLFLMLCTVGIKANLKNPKVHWLIEISNVTCQFLVALGTLLLFVL